MKANESKFDLERAVPVTKLKVGGYSSREKSRLLHVYCPGLRQTVKLALKRVRVAIVAKIEKMSCCPFFDPQTNILAFGSQFAKDRYLSVYGLEI